jgi:hypothetical protein
MYEELVKSLREKAEFLTVSDVRKAPPGLSIKNLFAETMSEAADAIEAMCEMVADAYSENANLIASYEDRLRWIPVTERLPEVGKEVLIYAVGKTEDLSSTIEITNRMIFRLLPSSEGVEMWSAPRLYFMTNYEITHWMPLPVPPKEENHGSV